MPSKKCSGDGMCLTTRQKCKYNCKMKICYFCNKNIPEWVLIIHRGFCMECSILRFSLTGK